MGTQSILCFFFPFGNKSITRTNDRHHRNSFRCKRRFRRVGSDLHFRLTATILVRGRRSLYWVGLPTRQFRRQQLVVVVVAMLRGFLRRLLRRTRVVSGTYLGLEEEEGLARSMQVLEGRLEEAGGEGRSKTMRMV